MSEEMSFQAERRHFSTSALLLRVVLCLFMKKCLRFDNSKVLFIATVIIIVVESTNLLNSLIAGSWEGQGGAAAAFLESAELKSNSQLAKMERAAPASDLNAMSKSLSISGPSPPALPVCCWGLLLVWKAQLQTWTQEIICRFFVQKLYIGRVTSSIDVLTLTNLRQSLQTFANGTSTSQWIL